MPGIEHDDTAWPICVIRFLQQQESEMPSHLETVGGYLARGERCLLLFDVRKARVLNSYERGLYVDFLREHRERVHRLIPHCGVVSTSPLHRGVLIAIEWMIDVPFETTFFSDFDAAMRWARELVSRDRGAAPAEP